MIIFVGNTSAEETLPYERGYLFRPFKFVKENIKPMLRLTRIFFLAAMTLLSAALIVSCGKTPGKEEEATEETTNDEHPSDASEHPTDSAEHPTGEHPADSTTNN